MPRTTTRRFELTLRLEEQARVDLAIRKFLHACTGNEAEEPLRETRFAVRKEVRKVFLVETADRRGQ